MDQTLVAPAIDAPSEAETAFEALYRSSRDDVYAYVSGLLRDRGAAEDVTAQAFERAYRRRATFKPERGSRRAWLFGIARNAALDELRRRSRNTELVNEPEDVAAAGAHEEAAEAALRRTTVERGAGDALGPRARADRTQVLRRARQRRDRGRDRGQRVERGHQAAPGDGEAERGMR